MDRNDFGCVNYKLRQSYAGCSNFLSLASWTEEKIISSVKRDCFHCYIRPQNSETKKREINARDYSALRHSVLASESQVKSFFQKEYRTCDLRKKNVVSTSAKNKIKINKKQKKISSMKTRRGVYQSLESTGLKRHVSSTGLKAYSSKNTEKNKSGKATQNKNCSKSFKGKKLKCYNDQSLLVEKDPKLKQHCAVVLQKLDFPKKFNLKEFMSTSGVNSKDSRTLNFFKSLDSEQKTMTKRNPRTTVFKQSVVKKGQSDKSLFNESNCRSESPKCDISYKLISSTPLLLRSSKRGAQQLQSGLSMKGKHTHSSFNSLENTAQFRSKFNTSTGKKVSLSLKTSRHTNKKSLKPNSDKERENIMPDLNNNLSIFASPILRSGKKYTQLHSKSDVGMRNKRIAKVPDKAFSFHVSGKDQIVSCKEVSVQDPSTRRASLRLSNISKNIPQPKKANTDKIVSEITNVCPKLPQSSKSLRNQSKKIDSSLLSVVSPQETPETLSQSDEEKKENILSFNSSVGKIELKIIPKNLHKNLFRMNLRNAVPKKKAKRLRTACATTKVENILSSVRQLRGGKTMKCDPMGMLDELLTSKSTSMSSKSDQGELFKQSYARNLRANRSGAISKELCVEAFSKSKKRSCDTTLPKSIMKGKILDVDESSHVTQLNLLYSLPPKNKVAECTSIKQSNKECNQKILHASRASLIEEHLSYLTDSEDIQTNQIRKVVSPPSVCLLHIKTPKRTILKEIKHSKRTAGNHSLFPIAPETSNLTGECDQIIPTSSERSILLQTPEKCEKYNLIGECDLIISSPSKCSGPSQTLKKYENYNLIDKGHRMISIASKLSNHSQTPENSENSPLNDESDLMGSTLSKCNVLSPTSKMHNKISLISDRDMMPSESSDISQMLKKHNKTPFIGKCDLITSKPLNRSNLSQMQKMKKLPFTATCDLKTSPSKRCNISQMSKKHEQSNLIDKCDLTLFTEAKHRNFKQTAAVPKKRRKLNSNIAVGVDPLISIISRKNRKLKLSKSLSCKRSVPKLKNRKRSKTVTAKQRQMAMNNSKVASPHHMLTKKDRPPKKKEPASKLFKDGSKEPTKGSLKRKQWYIEKLNKRSEGHEDDIFESKQFVIADGLLGDDSDSSELYQNMSTPKREFTLVPPDETTPGFEPCPSPVDFNESIRKDADEYLYRRLKRQKIKVAEGKRNPETETLTFEEKEKKLDIEKIMEDINNLKPKKKKRNSDDFSGFINDEEIEDYYFSDISDD